jgi:hypothetical protein
VKGGRRRKKEEGRSIRNQPSAIGSQLSAGSRKKAKVAGSMWQVEEP